MNGKDVVIALNLIDKKYIEEAEYSSFQSESKIRNQKKHLIITIISVLALSLVGYMIFRLAL